MLHSTFLLLVVHILDQQATLYLVMFCHYHHVISEIVHDVLLNCTPYPC